MKIKLSLITMLLILFHRAACSGSAEEPTSEISITSQSEKPTPEALIGLQVVEIGEMSMERAAHQATLLQTGQILITGGCTEIGCDLYLDSVELFNPETGTFQSVHPMSTPRAGHAAVLLLDGRVLVCGGWTGKGLTASAEIYDPATGQWVLAGKMNDARESLMAVPLQDGRVLVTGGSGGKDNPASAEVFDPATSTFSDVGPMKNNHYLAIALTDGRVLLTGGESESGDILRHRRIPINW